MACISLAFFCMLTEDSFSQKLTVNELEYFETAGVNVLVFSNQYNGFFFDEKTAGIEIIHHGVRTVTGGAVRLQHTPEQWDLIPVMTGRNVDKENNSIEVVLRYEEYDFDARLMVQAKDKGVQIIVFLDEPLPRELEGHAGFNLEFLPASYFEKTYLVDDKPGIFPLYPFSNTSVANSAKKIPQYSGHSTFDDRGRNEFILPDPLATGKKLVLAPEDPERYVMIESGNEDLMLFDGRNLAQNGWFIVRSLIPANKTGSVLRWYVEPHALPHWKRAPVIQFSQAGYHPSQEKVAVIELDKHDIPLKEATLYQVTAAGEFVKTFSSEPESWGEFLRYHYLTFDFSSVKTSGIYCIEYGGQKTNTFIIDDEVYNGIWHPTLDVWFPVQMDHMKVNEAYRTWHGIPFLDDALQAPVNHQHFDGYRMDSVTDTKYKPLERIPGLDVGGWFDAGDFDIQTASHCGVILAFVETWERFSPDRDQTYIDQETRYVDIHRPDGKPDILQQIEHGVLNIVAQVENIGHPVRGIVVPNLHQYHHLGDASTETDNLPYNPDMKPYESDGRSSGTPDDRWAFTNRNQMLDYHAAGTLAAAHRAMKDYNPSLADKCIMLAEQLWNDANTLYESQDTSRFTRFYRSSSQMQAALQLFITTGEDKYEDHYMELIWPALDEAMPWTIGTALQACPYFDADYTNRLKDYVIQYKAMIDEFSEDNPYGVPLRGGGWGGNRMVVRTAITNYYAHKTFPDIIGPEQVFRGLNYIFGCHPYSNVSFVSAVGTRSKKITYGNNRADFSFIAGGIVPGLLILKPDFPENKEDWPFLWGENECVIDNCAEYILLSGAVNELLKSNR